MDLSKHALLKMVRCVRRVFVGWMCELTDKFSCFSTFFCVQCCIQRAYKRWFFCSLSMLGKSIRKTAIKWKARLVLLCYFCVCIPYTFRCSNRANQGKAFFFCLSFTTTSGYRQAFGYSFHTDLRWNSLDLYCFDYKTVLHGIVF